MSRFVTLCCDVLLCIVQHRFVLLCCVFLSLRSNRFRGVGEQRKTKERYFCPREIGARPKIRKKGWKRGRKETLADKPLDFENLRLPANGAREWLDQLNIVDICRS